MRLLLEIGGVRVTARLQAAQAMGFMRVTFRTSVPVRSLRDLRFLKDIILHALFVVTILEHPYQRFGTSHNTVANGSAGEMAYRCRLLHSQQKHDQARPRKNPQAYKQYHKTVQRSA